VIGHIDHSFAEESEVRLKGDPREWYPQTEEKIEPFMFSYTTFGLRGNRVAVKVLL
jgi:hypothetical protein